MRIVEIEAKINGAHGNQMIDGANPNTFPVPVGWAILPEDMDLPNFPFGEVTVDKTQTPPVVTSWTPGESPEPEPDPVDQEPSEPSVWDELQAAYEEGVNSVD